MEKKWVCQNRARSQFVVPSFWKEGSGVVEINKCLIYNRLYHYSSLPPLTPPPRRRGLLAASFHPLFHFDTPSSLLTLRKTDASIVLLSLNRSLPSTLVRTPLLRRGGATGVFRAATGVAAAPPRGANPSFFLRCRYESGKAERATEDFRAAIDMAAAPQKGVRALK